MSALAVIAATLAGAPAASAAPCVWNGGTGAWSLGSNWSCNAVPGATDSATISVANSEVDLTSVGESIGALDLSSTTKLNLTASTLNLDGAVTNDGVITVAAGSILANQAGNLSIGGAGTITLDNSAGLAQIYLGNITLGANETINGSGTIGANQLVFTNNGLVEANVSTGRIVIDVTGGNGGAAGGVGTGSNSGLLNNATLEANNSTLQLNGGLYENGVGGVMEAANHGTLLIGNDVRILNGNLSSDATSTVLAQSATNYLTDVTLTGGSKLDVDNDTLEVNGTLTNNGAITVGGPTGGAILRGETSGAWSLAGTGSVVLDNSKNAAQIYVGNLTIGSGQTISGSGLIGANQLVFTNNGLVEANVSTGRIEIDVTGGSGGTGAGGVGTGSNSGLLNNATLEANNSTLQLNGGLYENGVGGVMEAANHGTLLIGNDVRIVNGDLSSDATSTVLAQSATNYLSGVTLTGGSKLDVDNDTLMVNGTLTNNGAITVGGPTGGSILRGETGGAWSLAGTGSVVLDNSKNNAQIYVGNLTIGSGQTISGSGLIGANQLVLTNNGLVEANVSTGRIEIDVTGGSGGVAAGTGVGASTMSGMLNNATLEANNSILELDGGLYENGASGVMEAVSGGTLLLTNDVRIVNGVLSSDATSSILGQNGTDYLNNVTLAHSSTLTLANDTIDVNGTLTNNGTVNVSGASGGSILRGETGVAWSLAGTGSVVLDNSKNNAQIYVGNLTIGSGQTISGSGLIGANQLVLTNNGLVEANVSTGRIEIDVTGGSGGTGAGGVGTGSNSGLLNNATLEANNSILELDGGLYENGANGVMKAVSGGTLLLINDVRIVNGVLSSDATSSILAQNGTNYLNNVTLANGSTLTLANDTIDVNGTLTNNGTVNVSGASGGSILRGETVGAWALNGTGAIILDDSVSGAQIYVGDLTIGSSQTISGSGTIGANQLVLINNGVIDANVASRTITIDVTGGSGGTGAGGVGTGGNSGELNNGAMEASSGGTLAVSGGLYENSSTGSLSAGTGSTVVFNSDANLANLKSGGALALGRYVSSTSGAQSTLNIRSNGANSIAVIGGASGPTDTVVTLSGTNSVFEVTPFGGGTPTTIDASLTKVDTTGELQLLNGRNFTVASGAFTNNGVVQLGASTFAATSYANAGTTFGNGTVTVSIANTGTVQADGGTLNTQAITGSTGTISTTASGTLSLGGASSAALLVNNGHLALNGHDVTVTSDYQNANFGAGNAFDGHANVLETGGQILAASATQTLSGPALTGDTLNVGNVRIGGSSSTTLTVTNNGISTVLRGAVQNTDAPSVALANANFTLNPNGGANTTTISYTGSMAGSLSGQTLQVVNNFDNVASQTVGLQGNVYQIAVAGTLPSTINLAAERVGGGGSTSSFTIANVAPNTPGFTESLSATASTASPFTVNGGASATTANLAAGGAGQSITVGLGGGTAGSFSGTVTVSNTSIPVAGSGFDDLALAGQTVTVNGKVYAAAVATLSSNQLDFGVVRQNTGSVAGSVTVTNTAVGALTDNLTISVGGTPSGVTSTSTPGPLAQGQSGAAGFSLNTSSAGDVSGSTSLGFTSTDADLAPAQLASQTVDFKGVVTQLATASLLKDSGAGVLSGGGDAYVLNLGQINANSGTITANLGVMNDTAASSFAEMLGGSFSGGNGGHFTFNGASFSGLEAGDALDGDTFSFNTAGAGNGLFSEVIQFDGNSEYAGLSNLDLKAISLTVEGDVIGGGGMGGVPEPAAWSEMLFGIGALGAFARRLRARRAADV